MRMLCAPAAVLAAAVCADGAQAAFSGPWPVPVSSFHATVVDAHGTAEVGWAGPGRFAVAIGRGSPQLFSAPMVEDRGTILTATWRGARGSVTRRAYAAQPDAYSPSEAILDAAETVLGRARGGAHVLLPTMLGGRPAYRSTVKIPFNDCAGLRRGTRDLWLDRRTLLPLRIVERREGRGPSGVRISYRQFGAPFRHGVLDALGAKPFRGDQGFRRTTPNRAASNLGYTPLVPRVLPPGFRLAVSGWAPRSAVNGAEGSIPPARRLFGAVYRFGAERIDLSERLSRGRDWLGDPFGHECIFESRTRVRIAGTPGWFAQGPDNPPHLYWRRGALLYTLTGPLPKRDLLAIAGSLAPAR